MKNFFNRSMMIFVVLLFSGLSLAYGQNIVPPGMERLADNILGVFTSPFIRVILAIFLCGSAITYAFNKDNEKIKRNCIAIGVAAAILVVSQTLVDIVWRAAS